ncbi:MAG: carboxypeptidase regulatory-like domain-containing protein [Planctomycetes bacterium]|nr:carboxypeptidase regulatory-like domain-containing protein [Planctomycetota bacterium]
MKKTFRWMTMSTVALLCGPYASPLHAGYEETELQESGTIVGVVSFEGAVPKPKTLTITTQDPPCHKDPIPSEALVVSQDKKVQWAVASIKKIASGKPLPPEDPDNPVVLDQQGCRFHPHVVVVPKRRTLRIFNSDNILHNVNIRARKNQPLNRGMPAKVKQMDVSFKRPEKIRVSCDVHDWMGAWIVVAEHPYYAVTGSDGTFRLENVPVGIHTVQIWHETLGKQEQEVVVKAGEETRVEFVMTSGHK